MVISHILRVLIQFVTYKITVDAGYNIQKNGYNLDEVDVDISTIDGNFIGNCFTVGNLVLTAKSKKKENVKE